MFSEFERMALQAQLVVILAGAGLMAQTIPGNVDVARAKGLLNSSRLVDRAWGAYSAGVLKDDDLHSLLIQQLRAANPLAPAFAPGSTYSAEFAYDAALLDALIQEGGTVPTEAILRFDRRDQLWQMQVLILLARSREPAAEEFLLAWRKKSPSHPLTRLAIEDVLLEMRSTRCFTDVLNELPITSTFQIWDGPPKPIGGGTAGALHGGSAPSLPEGFPPVGLYSVHDRPMPDSVLLAHGIRSVYYRRLVPPAHDDRPFTDIGRERSLREFLAAWNKSSLADAEEVFAPMTDLQWKDPAALSREIKRRLDAQAVSIRAFLSAARQNGAPDLRGTKLRITSVLKDYRRSSTTGLPEPSYREFTLE